MCESGTVELKVEHYCGLDRRTGNCMYLDSYKYQL